MRRPPRGIRNRNPGNIRRSSDRWKGLAPFQSDPAFFVFEAPIWGIRAMAVILRNYQRRHGLKTLAQIIGRWAPATENDTAAYIRAAAGAIRASPRATLNLWEGSTLRDLIVAIIRHENGVQPYDIDTVDAAIDLARDGAAGQLGRLPAAASGRTGFRPATPDAARLVRCRPRARTCRRASADAASRIRKRSAAPRPARLLGRRRNR